MKDLLQYLGLRRFASKTYWALVKSRYLFLYYLLAWSDPQARGLPVPPADLITLVAGTPDVAWFLLSGRRGSKSLFDALRKNGIAVDSLGSILDFGCGCGRVFRNLGFLKGAKLCGTDYNPALVAWCQDNISFGKFQTNRLTPPLDYGGGTFDLIYAFSVFTHLSEPLQFLWRDELSRILKRGGHLLISIHGEFYSSRLTPLERRDFSAGHLVVRDEYVSGTNTCSAYHPDKYIREELAKGFQVVDSIKEGAKGNPFQDIYLLRKL